MEQLRAYKIAYNESDAFSGAFLSICDAYSEALSGQEAFALSAFVTSHCSLVSEQSVILNKRNG